jgi:Protein of unknown function (DUF3995)
MLAVVVVVVFSALSLVHIYWAIGGTAGKLAAVPEVSGHRAFTPSAGGTLVVALGLAFCALLVAATASLIRGPLPAHWLRWLSYVLAAVLLARAIGDFRLVGFFKSVRGTRFARLDSVIYAPLCLLLAIGVFYVAHFNAA